MNHIHIGKERLLFASTEGWFAKRRIRHAAGAFYKRGKGGLADALNLVVRSSFAGTKKLTYILGNTQTRVSVISWSPHLSDPEFLVQASRIRFQQLHDDDWDSYQHRFGPVSFDQAVLIASVRKSLLEELAAVQKYGVAVSRIIPDWHLAIEFWRRSCSTAGTLQVLDGDRCLAIDRKLDGSPVQFSVRPICQPSLDIFQELSALVPESGIGKADVRRIVQERLSASEPGSSDEIAGLLTSALL